MTALLFIAVAVAGGVGAAARLVLDGAIRTITTDRLPVGTMVINVTGSLALGVIAGLALGSAVTDEWMLILGTGFLGGYTTFSTASLETVRLAQARRFGASAVVGLGTVVTATGFAALGILLGTAISS